MVLGAKAKQRVKPLLASITLYISITNPPSLVGGTQDTVAEELPEIAVTEVGELGLVRGVAEVETRDSGELPAMFLATTVKV